jgi:peptidoglycan/xylan/chitin deacetylase (PgdA/CDA1 family)
MFTKRTFAAVAAVAMSSTLVLLTTVAASGASPKPAKPVNTALPAISGSAQTGQQLTASTGTWSGSPTSFAYQWRRCNASGSSCLDIAGATGSAYTAVASDAGSTLRVVVIATNATGSTPATSNQTAVVAAAIAKPVNLTLPSISGATKDGQPLTAANGAWSGSPTLFTYQWQRCNTNGKGCANVASATANTYVLSGPDVGFTIRVVVTATNAGGSTAATSNQTALVAATPPLNTGLPQLSGQAVVGQQLSATSGTWSGSAPTYSYQWRSCTASCANITGAVASSYALTSNELGKTVAVVVTATNRAGSASATSSATAVVTAAVVAPSNTGLPLISGSAQEGQQLSTTDGSWSGSPATYSYQWQSCTSGSCADIPNAVNSTYTPTSLDVARTIDVVVKATNTAGTATATSAATAAVTPAIVIVAPANTGLPQVSGQTVVTEQLSTTDGSWSGSAATYSYQWRSCVSGSCVDIEGATGSTYTLTSNELGKTIEAVVTATNAAGFASATSADTASVTTPVVAPANTASPMLSGTAQEGQQLSTTNGSWVGSPAIYSYQWRSCYAGNCTDIALATNQTYDVSTGDVGKTLEVVVTATNTAGNDSATSDPTMTVTAATPIVTAPTNTGLPVISGNAQDGQQLSVSSGSWGGSPATYGYQWRSCSSGICTDTPAATDATYTAGPSDVGKTLVVIVTASNDAGFATATTAETPVVAAASPVVVAPASTAPPTIGGTAQLGQLLSADPGAWSGSPAEYSYQWRSCNTSGNDCSDIPGATGTAYMLGSADAGTTIRVAVTASNAAGFASATSNQTGVVQGGVRPISNDCSAGTVAFTFDDGPDVYTAQVMARLQALNLQATFFVLGNKVELSPQTLRDEAAAGFGIGNHTYDHQSFTGASTSTTPLTDAQIQAELDDASNAIVAAGVARPTLYRPPYGDINAYDDLLARNLGYRIVMPWGTPSGNIVDSRDWTGISAPQIVSNVTDGYSLNGNTYQGIKADSIIGMHDGDDSAPTMIQALQGIVDYMNAHHLCSTGSIRQDATGGVVPPPAPPEPTSGNLVSNPSLETLPANVTPASEPVCFQQAGANVASNVATWSLTSAAHTGSVAEQVNVTNWTAGDRKLVMTQRQSQSSCLAVVTPGKTYSMWVWYTGSWPYQGATPTKVSIVTYYRNSAGTWVTWQASPLLAPTSFWNLANFTSAPLPAGATAVSFGLAIAGTGTLTTDDYAMAVN